NRSQFVERRKRSRLPGLGRLRSSGLSAMGGKAAARVSELHPSAETLDLSDRGLVCVLSDAFELAEFGFELNRGFVAERGVQPTSIIDDFEEGADMGSGLVDRRISFAVHFFLLQRAHEALGLGVVIRVAGAA